MCLEMLGKFLEDIHPDGNGFHRYKVAFALFIRRSKRVES